ncbi:MAG: OmpA family protein [Gammaproteobacteria bacterium]|nr:OmpA family protein [Gammaproteobacteria bacterium]
MQAKRVTICSAVALLFVCFANGAASQQVKESLFQDATAAFEAAKSTRAEILAPRSYAKAVKHYRSAEQKFKRGRPLGTIRDDLVIAADYFKRASRASRLAQSKMGTLIKTRGDAETVEASKHAKDSWRRAEEKFSKAMIDLERGSTKAAEKNAKDAEKYYRDAELTAIKTNYLDETRVLLAKADKLKVKKYAPKTLQKAHKLLQQADKALSENRYDTDVPRSLAQQARYEAKHALYLAKTVRDAQTKKLSIEDLILDWEIPISQIAAATDKAAALDNGWAAPTKEIVGYIEDQQSNSQKLNQNVNELRGEIKQLKQILGGASEERVALSERLQAQARIRERFRRVEGMFTRNEARVLREADDIIIRLIGLNFKSGQSSIAANHFRLLTKVQNAIKTFPNSKLRIEGHTDSHGGDSANFLLSEQRANAVKQYLRASMRIDPAKIAAIGYGETRPVANNETKTGRAKNRRIDIVIMP